MNKWIIYVGGKSRTNYEIGKEKHVWGLKSLKSHSQMPQVKAGDSIFFVYNLTRPSKIFPKPIPGFPRVKNSEYFKFEGIAEEIVKGKITKGFYESSLAVWPDNIYQYRFNFIIESVECKVYFTQENVGDDLIKKALLSFHSKGDVANLSFVAEPKKTQEKVTLDINSQELSSLEGKTTYRIAKEVVRDAKLAKVKKEQHLIQYGKFFCEICNFSFYDFYGSQYDYIECHHINPLHQTGETETQLSDLILLCANCHRVVHQSKECMTIEKLKWIVTSSSYNTQ
ncbi:HNH endonuclease [Pseudescherichia sp.]|uniref:HNH endonuclease n=1 Tax=Pseudescherichia sp. TaxID=2055881 RepID=UPI00289653D9|nr:HNH endonuclease [Pseudescherichia sp.]